MPLGIPHSGSPLTAILFHVSPPRLHEVPDLCCLRHKPPGEAAALGAPGARGRSSGWCDQPQEPSQPFTPKPGAPRRPPAGGITPINRTRAGRYSHTCRLVCQITSLCWVNERQMTVCPGKHLLSKYFRAINLSQHSSSSAR